MVQINNYNPFIHDAATNLPDNIISELYIDIENSDIIESQRNVFVEGYRGSGKSMLLRHNTFSMRYERNQKLDFIGIYVSCITPFFNQKEHMLLNNNFQQLIINEHMLVLSMAINLLKQIKTIEFSNNDESLIVEELNFYFEKNINNIDDFFKFLKKELFDTQKMTTLEPENFYKKAYTYSSLILPLIESFSNVTNLKNTRFTFLIDDGQLLSNEQQQILNSWISFRDTTKINFKVAITSKSEYTFTTTSNSIILENHDYVVIDLEKNFFAKETNYYQFAKKIIEKRLQKFNITTVSAEEFFPEDENFTNKISEIKRDFIDGKFPELNDKTKDERRKVASKYVRAIYFRERIKKHKSNHSTTAYTGFNTLINISTGVIRNLLIPCSTMFTLERNKNENKIECISPRTQYESILEESKKKWESIKYLSVQIEGCDEETAIKLEIFLKNFGNKLKSILLDTYSSEKQILTFTIENLENHSNNKEIKKILSIAEKAGLLYSRIGPGKNGNRTTWYTPNRILWAELGLDPVGQNGRLNITPDNFEKMTIKEISYRKIEQKIEQGLFDEL